MDRNVIGIPRDARLPKNHLTHKPELDGFEVALLTSVLL